MAWIKIFKPMSGMYLFHVWCYVFGYCVLYGTWVLDGCDNYIICSTNCFLQTSLEFRKWLVYKDLVLRVTKLLVKLP